MRRQIGNWRRQFALGIEEIDQEHKVLFDCLDTLMFSLNTTFSEAEALAALDRLADYANIHFRVEECLMRLVEYPGLEAHKADHQQFVARVTQFRSQSMSQDISRSVAAYLTHWLLNHINHADRKYAGHIHRKRALPAAGRLNMEAGSA